MSEEEREPVGDAGDEGSDARAAGGRALRKRKRVDYALVEASVGVVGHVYLDAARFRVALEARRSKFTDAAAHVTSLRGDELTLEWVWRHGLRQPVRVDDRAGLGIAVPGPRFTVRDVADAVGWDRPIDIIDVATQTEIHGWTMSNWAYYFHNAGKRKATLNVISLEHSGTALEPLVRAPRVVRQLDWIDNVWPGRRHVAGQYPRVQHYCLMSVAGSYTDFHIDFGGTSVWYHVHTGAKTFLFVPPTPANLRTYEAWATSPDQATTFFGDLVDTCFQVRQ